MHQQRHCRLALVVVVALLSYRASAQSVPAWEPSRQEPSRDALSPPLQSDANRQLSPGGSTWIGGQDTIDPLLVPTNWGAPAETISPGFAPSDQLTCYVEPNGFGCHDPQFWQWRVLPSGVIWQSYWAGMHEPRIAGMAVNQRDGPALLEVPLGGRASILRYGSDGVGRPQGWELQIEGAAFARLNLDANWDLDATDFRFGIPLVYGRDQLQWKFSYYHLSSHMGDELAIREDRLDERINYSRDALVLGLSYYPLPAWRWYAEAGWAFHFDDGAKPWEFQFGVDIAEPGPTGPCGTPFLAVNGHLREEVNFGGNVVVQAGWLWRGDQTQTLRFGLHYYNGKSNQFEFYDSFEEQLGLGLWYDF